MRAGLTYLALSGFCLWVASPATAADADVQAQLEAMQQRMLELEDRLQVTNDQLAVATDRAEQQAVLIERAGLASENRAASSGVAAFLETLEIGGWVSGTYFYNVDEAGGRDLGGFNAGSVPGHPFHPDDNSFSLDQLWFELERPVSEDSRAGFRADIVFGKTAGLLSGDSGANDGLSGNDLEVYQAYAQYLAPIGNGITFQFGKFATVIGAEVAQSPYNFNITRGQVYNLFQPTTHTGLLASAGFGEGGNLSVGVVNETRSFPARDIDLNKNKALLWSLGYSWDTFGASFNGAWGSSDSGQTTDTRAGDKETILDVILSWDPTERFSAYVNADYIDSENGTLLGTGEFDGYGVALAGRYALTDRLGLALRGEYVDLDFDAVGATAQADQKIWGVTGTMDYSLTERLKLRGELRYDNVRSSDNRFQDAFFDSGSSALNGTNQISDEDDQLVAGVEVLYSF